LPKFKDLPFNKRPDLSPYIIHLTKNSSKKDKFSAYDNLISILGEGCIWASSTKHGFIKGPNTATCFMDVPFQALKYVLTPEDADPQNPRYQPYGIVLSKQTAYKKGCRPVLYLSNTETERLRIPKEELWRVVRFEYEQDGWISWLHEREWRCKGAFTLPNEISAVLVQTTSEARKLIKDLHNNPKDYQCVPRSVIPLSVLCQGLLCE
jgi:hypothetical protein